MRLIDPRVRKRHARLGLAHVWPCRYRYRRRRCRLGAPRDEHLERLTQQQRFVWGHPQELLQLHNGHVCATSGQQSPGFETA